MHNVKFNFKRHVIATSAVFICALAAAQGPGSEPQAGAGRGLINPMIENLTAAKNAVVSSATQLVNGAAAATATTASTTTTSTPQTEPPFPAVAGPAQTLQAPAAPQMKPLTPNPVKAVAVDTEGAINPLSGKSFSEEQLQRVLNANKLVTEIGRQQVEQAKNLVELNKSAADSRQIESAKMRSDAINITPPKKSIKPVRIDESLGEGEQVIKSYSGSVQPMYVPSGGMASGTVQIGQDNFTPQTRFDGQQPRVVYVDTQPAKVAQGGNVPFSQPSVPAPTIAPLPGAMMNQLPR